MQDRSGSASHNPIRASGPPGIWVAENVEPTPFVSPFPWKQNIANIQHKLLSKSILKERTLIKTYSDNDWISLDIWIITIYVAYFKSCFEYFQSYLALSALIASAFGAPQHIGGGHGHGMFCLHSTFQWTFDKLERLVH